MTAALTDQEKQRVLLHRLSLVVLLTGVLWRTVRYLLQFPIWGDEAMLCLNFLELDYPGLTHQLRNCQVAPLLFLWGELTALRWLGGSELSMHLLPFLAGLGGLLLFWRLTRLTLPPLAATLALGFLACAIWPVSMSTLAKPYSFDLFMALLLLVPAVQFCKQPGRVYWLALLLLATPVAVFGSYPVVFVAGAIGLALLPAVWRLNAWQPRLLFAAYNVTLVGCFLANYWIVGQGQLQAPAGNTTTDNGMQSYWAEGFPPAAPLEFVKWFVLTHTGQMTAYPLGASDGGSTLTALLCLLGAWRLWVSRQRALLVICAAPFALWFVAAVLHRFPYGASCRLSQHVAPAVCLTAGLGAAACVQWFRSAAVRRRLIVGGCALFVLVGVGGMVRDAIQPYRDPDARWMREEIGRIRTDAPPDAPIVVLNGPEEMDPVLRWHLGLCGDRVAWGGVLDGDKAAASREVVGVHYWCDELGVPERHDPDSTRARADFETLLRRSKQPWVLKKVESDTGTPADRRDRIKHLEQFRWALESAGGPAD